MNNKTYLRANAFFNLWTIVLLRFNWRRHDDLNEQQRPIKMKEWNEKRSCQLSYTKFESFSWYFAFLHCLSNHTCVYANYVNVILEKALFSIENASHKFNLVSAEHQLDYTWRDNRVVFNLLWNQIQVLVISTLFRILLYSRFVDWLEETVLQLRFNMPKFYMGKTSMKILLQRLLFLISWHWDPKTTNS